MIAETTFIIDIVHNDLQVISKAEEMEKNNTPFIINDILGSTYQLIIQTSYPALLSLPRVASTVSSQITSKIL